MADRQDPRRTITFDSDATVGEVLRQLEYLVQNGLTYAKLRATTSLAFDADGGFLRSITAEGEPMQAVESTREDRP